MGSILKTTFGGKMASILSGLIFFVFGPSLASASDLCKELQSEQMRLSYAASNLTNINTTRTPEGGPYRPFVVKKCINGVCEVTRNSVLPILKYLPNHPDANEKGYVAFPNINQKSEFAIFNMTAVKLKLLASVRACKSKILIDNGNSSFLIQYDEKRNSGVKEDLFNLNPNHQVISWARQDHLGKTTTLNFEPTSRPILKTY